MRVEIPFSGPTQEGRLSLVGAQKSVNLYPQLQNPGDKNKVSQYQSPGLKPFTTGSGICRSNGVVFKSKLYFVSGVKLISITSGGTMAEIGTLTTTTSRVELVAGRDYLALVDGTDGFTWNTTYSTFAQIKQFSAGNADTNTLNKLEDTGATFITDGVVAGTVVYNTTDGTSGTISAVDSETALSIVNTSGADLDLFPLGTEAYEVGSADFPSGATHITILDGYFIANKGGSDEFHISTVENPTAWAALDFANAEASPDDIIAHTANQKDLYLGGTRTMQVYYNSKNPDFPFDPYPNGVMQIGVEAKYSLVSSSHGVFWLGRSPEGEVRVVKAQGLQYSFISSSDIDWQINSYSDATDAIAWVEQDGDRTLYVITFPSVDKTFCFDVMLPPEIGWFEKKSHGIGRWRASGYGSIENKRVIGDYINSKFYLLDFNTYDEDGAVLERLRRIQIIHSKKLDITIWDLILDVEVGKGLATGQGSDPKIMFRYSNDGGDVWSSELWESLGKIGERLTEVFWSQLGTNRSWLLEWSVSDPISVNFLAAYADIEEADD